MKEKQHLFYEILRANSFDQVLNNLTPRREGEWKLGKEEKEKMKSKLIV